MKKVKIEEISKNTDYFNEQEKEIIHDSDLYIKENSNGE